MILTRRFLWIGWLATAVTLMGVMDVRLAYIGMLVFTGLVAVTAVEYVSTPGAEKISARRIVPRRLAIGTDNEIRIEVLSRYPRRLHVTLRDEPPDEWERRDVFFHGIVAPRRPWIQVYSVVPPRRGDYLFHDLNVACRGVWWGLVEKRFVVAAGAPVKVYPNYKQVHRFTLMAHRRKLNDFGIRPIRRYGEGTDFESLREYTPDDEYRRIDWNASARVGRVIVRQHQVERSQPLMMVLDCGRLMGTMGGSLSRLDHAVHAALMLAHLSMRQDDQVGVLVFDDRVRQHIRPRRHRGQLAQILESVYALQSDPVESNYSDAFEFYRMKQKRRSLAVVFTDVIDRRASRLLTDAMKSLYPRHLPLCVLMKDQALERIVQEQSQAPEQTFRKAAAAEVLLEREEVIADLRNHGVLVLDVLPGQLTVSLMNQYLAIKSRGLL